MTDSAWFSGRLKWCPTSISALEEAEEKVLSYVEKPFRVRYVEIPGNEEGKTWRIRTLTVNENEESACDKTPLVILHGMGSAIGLWVLNIDALSSHRPLYALDVLGFGLSSRPPFSNNPSEVEEQFVNSLESWRVRVGLNKFILLGHSMGGYIATAYAIQHPENISHLILAEPWGFPERDKSVTNNELPLRAKIRLNIMQRFNPLAGLRIAGPWGPGLVEKMRPDILQKYAGVLKDPDDMANYLYHCNAQTPSGESAFKTLSVGVGWAKVPMIPRITELCEDMPITFVYGGHSWMDSQSGYLVQQIRCESKVDVHVIPYSGHHVNADRPDIFNAIVQNVCENVDQILNESTMS